MPFNKRWQSRNSRPWQWPWLKISQSRRLCPDGGCRDGGGIMGATNTRLHKPTLPRRINWSKRTVRCRDHRAWCTQQLRF